MKQPLREIARTEDLVRLEQVLAPSTRPLRIGYRTDTGAIAVLEGRTIGAFDREHRRIDVPPSERERRLELTVERFALPTNGLPSGDGLRWRLMLLRARQEPRLVTTIESIENAREAQVPLADGGIVVWGHSHLDVAWLWNYTQTRRKAIRTFANALALMEQEPSFIFMQSQPQLYDFVEEADPELFARVQERVHRGSFDVQGAALWVEPDCNLPSGESLLRQMLYARMYCTQRFGVDPTIAWLPDTFGFARTLPTLLAHAGIRFFGTTKLQWNDTTRFAHQQFRWRGPDGSEIVAALIDAYEGGVTAKRVARARERHEPLVVGYGDGGGGPTRQQVRSVRGVGQFEGPGAWYERLASRREQLPVHDDELYLEYHRGTYTTHHDVKAANARCERLLTDAEERVAWCMAVHAPRDVVERLRLQLQDAWKIVLCNQFHDVLPGTSVRIAYDEAMQAYERAQALIVSALDAARAILPRAPRHDRDPQACAPEAVGDRVRFDNGIIGATLSRDGVILDLTGGDGSATVIQGNALMAYRDRPRKWDAWNIDSGYDRHRVRVRTTGSTLHDDGHEVRFRIGSSCGTMRVALNQGEPFLRVELAVDWKEKHTLLRVENWLAITAEGVTYGAPHGVVTRSNRRRTPEQRARFEVPGQRFALARDAHAGVAILSLDTYGWSARRLPKGGTQIGHSLLRSARWPDSRADVGEAQLTWAFFPVAKANIDQIERGWEHFAFAPRVRLFQSDDDRILVVACKPAHDGDGVIVRVRECNGEPGSIRVRCAARMRSVEGVDGVERTIDGVITIEGEEIVASISANGLRSFRVRF
jgi:alpha-mannosidase